MTSLSHSEMAYKRNSYIAVQAASYQDWLENTVVVASFQDWQDHTVVVAHLVVDCTLDAGLWFVFQNLLKKKEKDTMIPILSILFLHGDCYKLELRFCSYPIFTSPPHICQCWSDFRLHTTTVVTKCSQRSTNQNVC